MKSAQLIPGIKGRKAMRHFLLIVFVCFQMELIASGKAFELLEGGLTNRNYMTNIEGVPIVVRIGRENPAEIGIDRVREVYCHTLGAEMGVSPKISTVGCIDGCACLMQRVYPTVPRC